MWLPVSPPPSPRPARRSVAAPSLRCCRATRHSRRRAGALHLLEPRDAFLANLCEFALACPRDGAGDDLSPRGGGAAGAAKLSSPRGVLAAASEAAESGLVLAPKNVQSMRTLFNIAHRLANSLGPAWALVLETMNTLDRILNSPRTTTQARLLRGWALPACVCDRGGPVVGVPG